MENYGNYQFDIIRNRKGYGWYYKIYTKGYELPLNPHELFEFKNRARIAAVGHISLLENEKPHLKFRVEPLHS